MLWSQSQICGSPRLQEDAWEEDDEGDAEEDLQASGGHAPARQKGKKTAADRNRAARAKEQDVAVEVKQKLKQQRRDLQNMKLLEQELQGKQPAGTASPSSRHSQSMAACLLLQSSCRANLWHQVNRYRQTRRGLVIVRLCKE